MCDVFFGSYLHSEEMPVPNNPDQIDSNINNIMEKEILSQTYLQIIPVTFTNSRRDIEVHTNTLLDTGWNTILIQKDIADKLKLNRISRTMNISNVVTNARKISSQVVNFIVTSQTNKCDCFDIDDARVMSKLNIPNNKIYYLFICSICLVFQVYSGLYRSQSLLQFVIPVVLPFFNIPQQKFKVKPQYYIMKYTRHIPKRTNIVNISHKKLS